MFTGMSDTVSAPMCGNPCRRADCPKYKRLFALRLTWRLSASCSVCEAAGSSLDLEREEAVEMNEVGAARGGKQLRERVVQPIFAITRPGFPEAYQLFPARGRRVLLEASSCPPPLRAFTSSISYPTSPNSPPSPSCTYPQLSTLICISSSPPTSPLVPGARRAVSHGQSVDPARDPQRPLAALSTPTRPYLLSMAAARPDRPLIVMPLLLRLIHISLLLLPGPYIAAAA